MADNAQKLSFGSSLSNRAQQQIVEHVQLMSGRAPASIVQADSTNTILTINFETDGTYTLPQIQLPVHGSEYVRQPWQKGDKGFVGTADLDVGNMTGLGNQNPASFMRPMNLASLVWHPLGNQNFTPTDDKDSHLSYGKNGTIARDVDKKAQVKTSPTGGAQIQGGGDGQGNYPHSSTAAPDKVIHQSTAKVQSQSPTHEVSQDQTVGGNHSVSKNITAGQSISAPAGSIGGLSMIGGIISALGGGGGITAPSLANGASAANVGALGGDLSGMLPNPSVIDLMTLPPPAMNFANDAAAAAGGIAIGQLYRNGSVVMVRVT